jgi:hypothetical protein
MEACLPRDTSGNSEAPVSHRQQWSQQLRDLRLTRNETQSQFWGRFGVTQTRGSRFELGQEIPPAVEILLRLYLDGVVSDGDLWRARRRQRILSKKQAATLPREVTAGQ